MFFLLLALFVFWISFTKEMGIGVLFILQKVGECSFSSKMGEVGKIVEENVLLQREWLTFVANLCVYKSKKSKVYTKVTSFNKYIYIYPNFLE